MVPIGDGVPMNVNVSMTQIPSILSRALSPFRLTESEPGRSAIVQKRPLG
jgi:hypothetical protein